MKRNRGILATAQAGIEDLKEIFHNQLRAMVREGILNLMALVVTDLCGEIHRPDTGIYRRGGGRK